MAEQAVAPRTEAPPHRFMPKPFVEDSPVPAQSPTQPISAGSVAERLGGVPASGSGSAAISRIISQVPEAPPDDPKFVPEKSDPVETQVVTRSFIGRLRDRIFGS